MKYLIALAVLCTACLVGPANARGRAVDHCQGNLCFQAKVRTSCLRPAGWSAMRSVANRLGGIEVTSVCDGRHARHSQHYAGKAFDFRPLHTSPRAAVALLHTMPQVGGIGSYSNGLVHADVGERKLSWFRGGRTRMATRARIFRYASFRRHYAARY